MATAATFGLWADGLEPVLRPLPAGEVARLCGGFLDDLAALLHSVASARGSAPEKEPPRLRVLGGLARVLDTLACDRPVIAVLDDAHLADASSWEALRYLARHLAKADVGPLERGPLRELAQELIERHPSPELVDWLSDRSRGNALFAIGLVRALIEEGADLSAPRLQRLPESLAQRVVSRMKQLDEPQRSTLELLAVIGRRVA